MMLPPSRQLTTFFTFRHSFQAPAGLKFIAGVAPLAENNVLIGQKSRLLEFHANQARDGVTNTLLARYSILNRSRPARRWPVRSSKADRDECFTQKSELPQGDIFTALVEAAAGASEDNGGSSTTLWQTSLPKPAKVLAATLPPPAWLPSRAVSP